MAEPSQGSVIGWVAPAWRDVFRTFREQRGGGRRASEITEPPGEIVSRTFRERLSFEPFLHSPCRDAVRRRRECVSGLAPGGSCAGVRLSNRALASIPLHQEAGQGGITDLRAAEGATEPEPGGVSSG
jgi:hypothetical protein